VNRLTAYVCVPQMLGMVTVMYLGLKSAAYFDRKLAYRDYYPRWHGCMVGKETSFWQRSAAAGIITILSDHPILGLFFLLPTSEFSRTQKAMMIYIMVLMY
jgi:hypothetical protein